MGQPCGLRYTEARRVRLSKEEPGPRESHMDLLGSSVGNLCARDDRLHFRITRSSSQVAGVSSLVRVAHLKEPVLWVLHLPGNTW